RDRTLQRRPVPAGQIHPPDRPLKEDITGQEHRPRRGQSVGHRQILSRRPAGLAGGRGLLAGRGALLAGRRAWLAGCRAWLTGCLAWLTRLRAGACPAGLRSSICRGGRGDRVGQVTGAVTRRGDHLDLQTRETQPLAAGEGVVGLVALERPESGWNPTHDV